MHPVWIDSAWRPAQARGEFVANNPRTGQTLQDVYPVSDAADYELALQAAVRAAAELEQIPAEQIAKFLDRYAERIESAADALCNQAELETGLPATPRLKDVELPRTANQLRLAATAARAQSWRHPIRDDSAGVHSCFGPVGPVVVFGPNNFPLAFNAISGGDFAAAIAAGNPVIAKAHPAHPGTSRLLAAEAAAACEDAELPAGSIQMLYGLENEAGLKLVADPRVGSVAFTGSRRGGLALKAAADAVGTPIYLEMSSVNPVFFLPGALQERGEELAAELAGSVLLGAGQFCTCPNLVVLPAGDAADQFVGVVQEKLAGSPTGCLLTAGVCEGMAASVAALQSAGARLLTGGTPVEADGFQFANTLLSVSGEAFLSNAGELQTEAFGPASLVVIADAAEQLLTIADQIEGSLTGSVYSSTGGEDDTLAADLMRRLRRRVGRLLNDKMPTGVAVSPAMNHGGPFPATGHPGFTAVGMPASIRRFTKLDCYDNVREHRLPACLQP